MSDVVKRTAIQAHIQSTVTASSEKRDGTDLMVKIRHTDYDGEKTIEIGVGTRFAPGPALDRRDNGYEEEWFDVDPEDCEALYHLLGEAIAKARASGLLPTPEA